MLSRLSGLVREYAINRWLGVNTAAANAFAAALQIPKVLQNLLGEGSLSASFVPVYSERLGIDDDDARGVASGVLGLLIAAVAVLVLLVVAAARPLVWLVARGFDPATRDLTVDLLRVMAPGIGAIVLGAWCLGVLNSHRQFFLSYVAPVLWNVAIVVALALAVWQGDGARSSIARVGAIGVLIGGVAQFVVQLPSVWRVAGAIRPSFAITDSIRTVLKRFVPAVSGRGVVTLSTYIDLFLVTFLASGALRIVQSAQVFYLLPISVFAMSVAAADLPELSREQGALDEARQRIHTGVERIALFIVFSAVAFVVAGLPMIDVLVGQRDASIAAWLTLAAYSLGLVASGISRLLQNASFAAGDTKGPARIVAIRVAISIIVGVVLMFQLDRIGVVGSSLDQVDDLPAFGPLAESVRNASDETIRLGAVGLALGASVAAWLELWLLRRSLTPVYGSLGIAEALRRLLPAAAVATVIAGLLMLLWGSLPTLVVGGLAIGVSGAAYVLIAARSGSPTAASLLGSVARLRR